MDDFTRAAPFFLRLLPNYFDDRFAFQSVTENADGSYSLAECNRVGYDEPCRSYVHGGRYLFILEYFSDRRKGQVPLYSRIF